VAIKVKNAVLSLFLAFANTNKTRKYLELGEVVKYLFIQWHISNMLCHSRMLKSILCT